MTEREKLVAKMRALGSKGGNATKAKNPPDHFKAIGKVGGAMTKRRYGKTPEAAAQRRAASEMGANKMRTILAAGKTVLDVTGD